MHSWGCGGIRLRVGRRRRPKRGDRPHRPEHAGRHGANSVRAARPSEITIFDKQVWIGHDAQFSIIEAIDPATNQTSAAVQVEDFAGSVAGGAGTVWTNSYNAMRVFRISPR